MFIHVYWPLTKSLFKNFVHFFYIVCLSLIFRCFLYNLDNNYLSDTANVLSQPVTWLFTLSDILKLEISVYKKILVVSFIIENWPRILYWKEKPKNPKITTNFSYCSEVKYFHKWNFYIFMSFWALCSVSFGIFVYFHPHHSILLQVYYILVSSSVLCSLHSPNFYFNCSLL